MLKAIIFDFNGVISDDEPIHLASMLRVLEEESIQIPLDEYSDKYLGRDDRDCFQLAFEQTGRSLDVEELSSLIERKSAYYRQSLQRELKVFPGVVSFIEQAYLRYELAIASGALRSEIEFVVDRLGLRDRFRCLVSSHEIDRGKPAPDIFLKALEGINLCRKQGCILPVNCLVIEDSQAGVNAALSAGMKCLAVSNTYSPEHLTAAHRVVASLEMNPAALVELFP
jgi:HAD superfamily hydrolase (TIGR01509 family)